ncbi:D-alanyl-D-alanine carboxypeptidase family protein [Desulfosoma caldarium]|uniref:serine-type D-Ala-D-Ala carboxypeptidase n=1 Tax=Desulfosoma caldarium TaxID=610254 RepID=A0A3N1VHU7_9BACT|nr:D-alanyl-D-alanine carboxypeptidase family protein [Desulfosoma caldarium]ROR01599.1 penicillin-binding protein 6 [Desulfosoma caldarium]
MKCREIEGFVKFLLPGVFFWLLGYVWFFASPAPAWSAAELSWTANATSGVLLDVTNGETLWEQNPDDAIAPASFTKLLTLYLVFEALEKGDVTLNDPVHISKAAWRTGGSKMFVEVGNKIALEELIKGIAVVSGNDACVAVAEHLYGSVEAFVAAMNQKAKELGMHHSHFANPHGLPAQGQVTTARDMATLAMSYLRRFPQSLRFHSMTEYTYHDITQPNRNRLLLKDSSVDGLKTGYVSEAGYHLMATAQRHGLRLLAVVMGAPSPAVREKEALALLNLGYRLFAFIPPPSPDQAATVIRVWKGAASQVSLFFKETNPVVVRKEKAQNVHWVLDVPSSVMAPIHKGQTLGRADLKAGDATLASLDLVSNTDIARANLFVRLWHSILLLGDDPWQRVWNPLAYTSSAIVACGVALLVFMRLKSRRSRKRTFFG